MRAAPLLTLLLGLVLGSLFGYRLVVEATETVSGIDLAMRDMHGGESTQDLDEGEDGLYRIETRVVLERLP